MLENEAAMRIAPVQDFFAVNAVSTAELERAKAVHAAHAAELLKQPGVQGVGITSSADAPGEAALMIFLIRGEKHNAIPAEIDGLRTRVRETSRFTAGRRGEEPELGCRVAAVTGASRNVRAEKFGVRTASRVRFEHCFLIGCAGCARICAGSAGQSGDSTRLIRGLRQRWRSQGTG